eukprot:jgi/Psemu1/314730/fgenesh1_kg.1683_\
MEAVLSSFLLIVDTIMTLIIYFVPKLVNARTASGNHRDRTSMEVLGVCADVCPSSVEQIRMNVARTLQIYEEGRVSGRFSSISGSQGDRWSTHPMLRRTKKYRTK